MMGLASDGQWDGRTFRDFSEPPTAAPETPLALDAASP
jgi:hypothetical protein